MKFEIKRESGTLTVERQGASKPWKLLLVGIKTVKSVESGMAESTPIGALVTPNLETNHLRISWLLLDNRSPLMKWPYE